MHLLASLREVVARGVERFETVASLGEPLLHVGIGVGKPVERLGQRGSPRRVLLDLAELACVLLLEPLDLREAGGRGGARRGGLRDEFVLPLLRRCRFATQLGHAIRRDGKRVSRGVRGVLLGGEPILGRVCVARGAGRVGLDGLRAVTEFGALPPEFEQLRLVSRGVGTLVLGRRVEAGDLLPRVGEPALVVPQPLLRPRHFPVEFAERLLQFGGAAVRGGDLDLEFGQHTLLGVERGGELAVLACPQPDAQLAQSVRILLVLLGLRGLHPERAEVRFEAVEPVLRSRDVGLRDRELAERFGLLRLEPADARGLVEDFAAVAGGRLEQLVHPALRDDRVAARAGPAAEEDVLEVLEPRDFAVDEVLAGPVAVHAARELHLVRVHRQ